MAEFTDRSLTLEAIADEQVRPLVDPDLPFKKRYVGIWIGIVSPVGEFVRGYGELEVGKATPPDDRTFFEIGSISKVFTGIALARSGLDLNSEVQGLLPKGILLPNHNGSQISLFHLVTHTSGLPSIADNVTSLQEFLEYTPSNAYSFLAKFELKRTPGSEYGYSNFGFGLLAHVLKDSVPDDQTRHFENLVRTVAMPLDMNETVIKLSKEQNERLTESYDNDGKPHAHWNWGSNAFNAGAGSLKSTGRDLLKFLKANLGLNKSTMDMAIELSHTELFRASESLSIGYGWHILKLGSERIVWHNGGTGGFQTFLGFNKAKGTGVIVLTNTAHGTEDSPVDPRIDQAAINILKKLQ